MKKFFRTTFFVLSLVALILPIKAVSIDPSSGNFDVGDSTTFNLHYSPPESAPSDLNGVVIYISVTGGTVTSFTSSTDENLLSVAGCPGGSFHSENLVCVDISTVSGTFTTNENFGSFIVEWDSSGQASLDKTDNTLYIDTEDPPQQHIDSGNLGTFTIAANITITPTATPTPTVTPTTARTPETGIVEDGGSIFIGLSVVAAGGILYKYSSSKFKEHNE